LRLATALKLSSAALVFALLTAIPAYADPAAPELSHEIWAGVDAATHVWLAYTGTTIAPYGGMFEDGLRLRAATGYGRYFYTGDRNGQLRSFSAQTVFTDALVGYLKRMGPLTAKAFVGASAIQHDIAPFDPQNPVEGLDYGPKAVAEFWLNMGPSAWSSLDLNWTSAHDTYAGRLRGAYRVMQHVSLGAEARVDGNALDKDTRGGLFLRYDWATGEVSAAVGVSGRSLENARDMTDPYATLTWLMQY
jgi:hypothetical protein